MNVHYPLHFLQLICCISEGYNNSKNKRNTTLETRTSDVHDVALIDFVQLCEGKNLDNEVVGVYCLDLSLCPSKCRWAITKNVKALGKNSQDKKDQKSS